MIDFTEMWRQEDLLERSFHEYIACVQDALGIAQNLLHSPDGTPPLFNVRLGPIPEATWSIKRNLFSTLFQSVYHLMKIDPRRRLLYGKLNHLFRVWVTSADNLLDNEDKVVFPIDIAGSSRIMRQVISIMLADRIMHDLTVQAVRQGVLSNSQADVITEKSLQILLPSAAEEASEEGGILHRPDAEYVLQTIHRLKTGLLFHIPLLGPDHIEESLDKDVLSFCKDGLMNFGLGCQILDDIRDLAKDFLEARHNYILSQLFAEHPLYEIKLEELRAQLNVQANIFEMFPDVVHPAAERALGLLESGLSSLASAGLGIDRTAATMLSLSMFETLGVGELIPCLSH